MTERRLALRRSDFCANCGVELHAGTSGWWDSELRTVRCESCHNGVLRNANFGSDRAASSAKEARAIAPKRSGIAGRSANEEYERRHLAREARIDAKFGKFAGVIKFLTDDPQSITAWKKGSIGERKLAASLEENLGARAILLHDRRVPGTRGNIDHLVVAGSGVWVVDAKNYSGLVQLRDVGGFFKIDNRL